MRPLPIVVSDELVQDPHQLMLIPDDQVVEALPAERANHPLRDRICLRSQHGRADSVDDQAPQPSIKVPAIHAVAVMDEMARLPTIGRAVEKLLPHPRHGGMGGHVLHGARAVTGT